VELPISLDGVLWDVMVEEDSGRGRGM
jgi:hypothetical protein